MYTRFQYNDILYAEGSRVMTPDNRGFCYGDGLFETLRFTNEKIHLEELHFDRLFKGLAFLSFELPKFFTPAYLAKSVEKVCKYNKYDKARVRITVFRDNGGLYDVNNHYPQHIIQASALENADFELNEKGLTTGIYPDARMSMDIFSNLKSKNYLPYTSAALYARKKDWNDIFLLNAAGRICDASIANVFIVKDQVVYTCPLTEGCIAGVMRKFLLATLPGHGFKCQEKNLTEEDLLAADEVFLTNAIKGIRWVARCGDSSYTNQLTTRIFDKLLKKS